jgi:hypothetical protein
MLEISSDFFGNDEQFEMPAPLLEQARLSKIEFARKGKADSPPESGGVARSAGVVPKPKRYGYGTTPRVIALAAL